jgi:hypothetical protein
MMKKVGVKDILGMIPEELFQEISAETRVDKHVKKLTGRSIFQVFLLSLIGGSPSSLTVMSRLFSSEKFRLLCGETAVPFKTNKTSISDRLNKINPEFFEKIFAALVQKFDRVFIKNNSQNVTRFDSTILTLSSKLLSVGTSIDKGNKNQIKFTVSFDQIPRTLNIHFTDNHTDEIPLRTAIREFSVGKDSIAVFDRGLSSRAAYKSFDDSGIQFITRLKSNVRYQVIKELSDVSRLRKGDLKFKNDYLVYLASKGARFYKHPFRLICAENTKTGENLYFLTNNLELSAKEVTDIYKKRWDIEVFFKFIKQELNAKHFHSRSENGIKVTFYMILITSFLLLVYKYLNKMTGYKFVKWDFVEELDMIVARDLAQLYAQNIEQFDLDFPVKTWPISLFGQ